jgi:hypothetical protein
MQIEAKEREVALQKELIEANTAAALKIEEAKNEGLRLQLQIQQNQMALEQAKSQASLLTLVQEQMAKLQEKK